MTLKIVKGDFDGAATDNATAIEFLEQALAEARKGHVVCVVLAMFGADSTVTDGWSGCTPKNLRPYTVVGALEELKLRYRETNIEQR